MFEVISNITSIIEAYTHWGLKCVCEYWFMASEICTASSFLLFLKSHWDMLMIRQNQGSLGTCLFHHLDKMVPMCFMKEKSNFYLLCFDKIPFNFFQKKLFFFSWRYFNVFFKYTLIFKNYFHSEKRKFDLIILNQ